MTLVKICGITNLEDARHALEHGADELGFNFYSKSKRYIFPDAAKAIISELPASVSKVGVFVNMSLEGVLETARFTGITAIQLHGDEDTVYVRALRSKAGLKIIRAFRVERSMVAIQNPTLDAHAILLDSYQHKEYGGTGMSFDWNIVKNLSEFFPTIYLAGGLVPENVAEAIRTVRPYAVDVASGVESSPGKKDPKKVEEFIRAVRTACVSGRYELENHTS